MRVQPLPAAAKLAALGMACLILLFLPFPVFSAGGWADAALRLSLFALFLCVTVAILFYRLWEIRRLLERIWLFVLLGFVFQVLAELLEYFLANFLGVVAPFSDFLINGLAVLAAGLVSLLLNRLREQVRLPILLVGDRIQPVDQLFYDSLGRSLREKFRLLGTVSQAEALDWTGRPSPGVLLYYSGSQQVADFVQSIRALRGCFPDARLLALVHPPGTEAESAAVDAGADRCVDTGTKVEELERIITEVYTGKAQPAGVS